MSSSAKSSIDRPVANLRENRVVKNVEESDNRSMITGSARVVQVELSTDRNFKMIADVGHSGCRQKGWEGLTGWSGNQLVVVDLVKNEKIAKGPFQADILYIVAQVQE